MKIAIALSFLRFCFGLTNCGQQKRSENCDDGDDDQKFNECERNINMNCHPGP